MKTLNCDDCGGLNIHIPSFENCVMECFDCGWEKEFFPEIDSQGNILAYRDYPIDRSNVVEIIKDWDDIE